MSEKRKSASKHEEQDKPKKPRNEQNDLAKEVADLRAALLVVTSRLKNAEDESKEAKSEASRLKAREKRDFATALTTQSAEGLDAFLESVEEEKLVEFFRQGTDSPKTQKALTAYEDARQQYVTDHKTSGDRSAATPTRYKNQEDLEALTDGIFHNTTLSDFISLSQDIGEVRRWMTDNLSNAEFEEPMEEIKKCMNFMFNRVDSICSATKLHIKSCVRLWLAKAHAIQSYGIPSVSADMVVMGDHKLVKAFDVFWTRRNHPEADDESDDGSIDSR